MHGERVRPLLTLVQERLDWEGWEALIRRNGVVIDRPTDSIHPYHPEIVYPIDYGFIRETLGTDEEELDVFVGSAKSGLVAAIFTTDYRRGDRECKLIYNATPAEIYLVNGFINFDATLMDGVLVMRFPMRELWRVERGC